jgi:hypothetical protein
MLRCFGSRSLTTSPPIRSVPPEIVLEPRDHPQRRRLAAAGGADEDDEFAVLDRQVDAVDVVMRLP